MLSENLCSQRMSIKTMWFKKLNVSHKILEVCGDVIILCVSECFSTVWLV